MVDSGNLTNFAMISCICYSSNNEELSPEEAELIKSLILFGVSQDFIL
jgi:hypothetical protein